MSAKNIPRISETEWEVMRAVWAKHPAPASEIIERLSRADPSWHPKTAKTLLTRLVQKRRSTTNPGAAATFTNRW